MIAHLFVKYGDQPLTDLLNDLGVTREVIMAEADAWAVPLIGVLQKEGYIEALVRRRLSTFYTSAAARKMLEPKA